MRKIALIVCLIMILSAVAVFGEPPFIQDSLTIETEALVIVYPKINVYPKSSDIVLPFDVLDNNFSKLDNTTTECSFNVVEHDGSGVKSGSLIYNGTLEYWYFNLNSTDLIHKHDYNYYVHCNTTTLNGFVSLSFKVTEDGVDYENHTSFIAIVVLVLGVVGLLFKFSDSIDVEQEWSQAIKLLVNLVAIIILLTGSGFSVRAMQMFNMNQNLVNISIAIFISLIFVVLPVFFIFFLLFLKSLMEFWKSMSDETNFE